MDILFNKTLVSSDKSSVEELQVMLVGKDKGQCIDLVERLRPEYHVPNPVFTNNLAEALQINIEQEFRLCFIYDGFEGELESFMRDIKSLGRLKTCGFFKITNSQQFGELEERWRLAGFTASLSKQLSSDEKKIIETVFEAERRLKDVEEKCGDVHDALAVLLRAVDSAAKSRKRGRYEELEEVIQRFIAERTDFDGKVLDTYFDELSVKTDFAKPFSPAYMNVSEKWKKKLPEMTDDGYTGVSHRAWDRLRKKFGKKD